MQTIVATYAVRGQFEFLCSSRYSARHLVILQAKFHCAFLDVLADLLFSLFRSLFFKLSIFAFIKVP